MRGSQHSSSTLHRRETPGLNAPHSRDVITKDESLMQDRSWREVLRFCAARGAYRGAGYSAMTRLLRGGTDLVSAEYPGLTDALANEQAGDIIVKSAINLARCSPSCLPPF